MAPWDWLELLPPHERGPRRQRRRIQRLRSQLVRPRSTIALLVAIYLVVVVVLARFTGSVMALLAMLPLILAPLLSALIYWLLWSDFHR
jgi:preprotein translocase subunit SecF